MQNEFNKIKDIQSLSSSMMINVDHKLITSLIQELVMSHFENLGSALGDCLSVTEILNYAISHNVEGRYDYDSKNISNVNGVNVDKLAAGLDNILKIHITSILSECKNLVNEANI